MVILNATSGGTVSQIPSGQGMLDLTWVTDDGRNLESATFSIVGTRSYTASTDANGLASLLVDVGTYAISLTHEGQYNGDSPKTITVASRQSYSLIWFGTTVNPVMVILNSPRSFPSASYTITGAELGVVQSGTGWNQVMNFTMEQDVYTLSVTLYGVTSTFEFEVDLSNKTVDLSEMFCLVWVSDIEVPCTVRFNGYSVGSFGVGTGEFYVLRSPSAYTLSASIDLYYSGLSTTILGSYSSKSVTPNSATNSTSILFTGSIVTLTSSGSLTVPCGGEYRIMAIGGGGSGGSTRSSYGSFGIIDCGGGGGSGRIVDGEFVLPKTSYEVTIGAGGASMAGGLSEEQAGNPGEASSFGTIVSASGGDAGDNGHNGGSGGAGGGGGGQGDGGNGEYGGGGGASGRGSPGEAGPRGGSGGACGDDYNVTGHDGGVGAMSAYPFYGTGSYSGGAGGESLTVRSYAGGGGGGGHASIGGDAGAANGSGSLSYAYSGGGGGGGVAGGRGGKGGDSQNSSSSSGGEGGYGYGAGGGGAGGYGRYNGASGTLKHAFGGGGGGGGMGSTKLSGDVAAGETASGAGAPGAVRIQFIGGYS